MPHVRCSSALHAVWVGVIVLAIPIRASQAEGIGTLSEITLPGGLRSALAVLDDRVPPDRGQFLLEFIRRTHDSVITPKDVSRYVALSRLLAHLDRARQSSAPQSADTVPLPLSPKLWTDVVFGGKVAVENLAVEILRSRNAALLYCGLLSLDDETREWLASQPELVAELATRYPAAFLIAAPGLRVAGNVARFPGGQEAVPVWEALAGRRANEPAQLVRALVSQRDGRLAWFLASMSQLSEPRLRAAMQLDVADVANRVAAARKLLEVFERVAPGWKIPDRAFWRPALDPGLLIADLKPGAGGRPRVPGTRRFWTAVFAAADENPLADREASALAGGDPVDLVWLCERVFEEPVDQRRRYRLVLFASRVVGDITPESVRDAVEAVRAAGTYPSLVDTLERAHVTDVSAIASAARRAARLSDIGDDAIATRSLAQFQGALAVLARAALRGSLSRESLTSMVSSTSAIEPGPRGEYEGRMIRKMAEWLRERRGQAELTAARGAGPSDAKSAPHDLALAGADLDLHVLRLVAGAAPDPGQFVEWEGTRYRVDLAAAEVMRLEQFLADDTRPYFATAETLVGVADRLTASSLGRDAVRQLLAEAEQALTRVDLENPAAETEPAVLDRYRDTMDELRRARSSGDVGAVARLAPALRSLADALAARGFLVITYAMSLGQPENVTISVTDAASRHDFDLVASGPRRRGSWLLPVAGSDARRGWHVTGSLLALDVRIAEFSLRRTSAKPPAYRPSLNDEDRRVLTESVALVEPQALTDADQDRIASAIRRGRARLAAISTPAEAVALADQIPLSESRRTLLAWAVAHDRDRLPAHLAPSELLLLGLDTPEALSQLDPWGVSTDSRLGCLCPQMVDRRQWEALAGRWTWGMIASAFPDLNLRLAEMLADLRMPAVLLGSVLTAASLDFINGAVSRDPDDRRGLVEFVQALRRERFEEYLALLTTDGPLVPVDKSAPAPGDSALTAAGGRQ